MFTYSATVERIVDGDTIDLNVDLGFRVYHRDRFRLLGIDTPERGQAGWAEATAALTRMIPPGSSLIIKTATPLRDKYGRWLARLFVGTIDINQLMIDQGHAVPYPR